MRVFVVERAVHASDLSPEHSLGEGHLSHSPRLHPRDRPGRHGRAGEIVSRKRAPESVLSRYREGSKEELPRSEELQAPQALARLSGDITGGGGSAPPPRQNRIRRRSGPPARREIGRGGSEKFHRRCPASPPLPSSAPDPIARPCRYSGASHE